MTEFQPHLAAMRFGVGRAPDRADPPSVAAMMQLLRGVDEMALRYPVQGMAGLNDAALSLRTARKERQQGKITRDAFQEHANTYRTAEKTRFYQDFAALMARAIATPDGFRERLVLFWADHFAVEGREFLMKLRTDGFTEDAIRPHVAGKFGDMLRAAALHPVMINFLNQDVSVGPNSPYAKGGKNEGRGLNENLAREILELHTLGVQGAYTQTDVRQFAELLAGVALNGKRELVFSTRRAEPGSEQVLDFVSQERPSLEDVTEVLDRLAVHPDTARHLSTKLAVHFVSDTPDPDLVAAMTARYMDTGGDLAEVYEAMLSHSAAMSPDLVKVKRPIEFIMSTLRVLGADPGYLVGRAAENRPGPILRGILQPMARMGQPWGRPGGPDGWPETDQAWITPNSLAERTRWAIRIQTAHGMRPVEPQAVLYNALGPLVDERIAFAVSAAETREEAVALVLMSPAFQRR